MKNRLMLMTDRILLRRRAIIESIIDQLKNISQIEHSRHRSIPNFFVNVLCGLIAYCRKLKKTVFGLGRYPALARLTRIHVNKNEVNLWTSDCNTHHLFSVTTRFMNCFLFAWIRNSPLLI